MNTFTDEQVQLVAKLMCLAYWRGNTENLNADVATKNAMITAAVETEKHRWVASARTLINANGQINERPAQLL